MTKRDYGILWAGYNTYVCYVIYTLKNGKFKCYKNKHHNAYLYDNVRYLSSERKEREYTRCARDGIDKVLNNYREAIEWARNNR